MLISCFIITTLSTIAIVLITRARRRSKKKTTSDSPIRGSPLLETSPRDSGSSQASKRQSPLRGRKEASKDSGTFSVNYGINSAGRLRDPSWYEPSSSAHMDDSNKNIDRKVTIQDEDSDDDDKKEDVSEETLLLPNKRDISPEPASLGFGMMSESMGLWYRDASGKHLTRFVVLHVFLIFSMLMVGNVLLIKVRNIVSLFFIRAY